MSSTQRVDSGRRPKIESDILGRQPPYDSQAEIGVLGSIMLLPDVLDDVVMILRPDDFYDDAHRKLFEHMCMLHSGNKKIDPTLLIDRLKMAGDFELVGGSAYLSKIINAVPNAAHATFYAEIVRQKSTYRSLITAATEILREAYDESQEAPQMLSSAEQRIFAILDERGEGKVESIKDVLHECIDRLDARMKGEHEAGGCDYGFADLDAQTSGLHKSELVIIAARPSMGKTAFAMNIAENIALGQNQPVLFVSLEMSAIELADRLLCSVAKVNGHRLRNGTISQEDRNRIVEKASLLAEAPLFVDDSPGRTVTEIAASARRIKRRMGAIGAIIIDYLQLIEPDNAKDPRQEQVAKIARRLKGLAREMEVPVICLAQLNRQTEASKDNIPRLSHLRESGAIEQDADVVMFVHREEYYARGEEQQALAGQAQIIVAKQRNGPIGEVDMLFRKEFTRFEDKAPKRFEGLDQYNDGGFSGGGEF